MLARDFIYYRPQTLEEALAAYQECVTNRRQAAYYGGGSEIITMCRAGSLSPDAIIDLKGIPECTVLATRQGILHLGGCLSLRTLRESEIFPFLSLCVGRIADHTNQNRITLGGNLCGTIIYREALLPLLLCDATLLLAGPRGLRHAPVEEIFREQQHLEPGEFIVRAEVDESFTTLPYWHQKKTGGEKIDYPLLSIAALHVEDRLRLSFSGICSFPFRSRAMEEALNLADQDVDSRVDRALELLPAAPRTDSYSSSTYRLHLLRHTLTQLLQEVS